MKTLLSFSLALVATSGFAQLYSNGPMATGAVSSLGTNAPAGTQWSELQTSSSTPANGTIGYSVNYFSASAQGPFRQGDDFTVPTGKTWAIDSLTVYGFLPAH